MSARTADLQSADTSRGYFMRNDFYAIEILYRGEWVIARHGTMSRSCAEGLLAQFSSQYSARLFRGYPEVKLVKTVGK